MLNAFKMVAEKNYTTVANSIIGMPDETRELIFDTINLMSHSKNNALHKYLLMPPAYYKYHDEGPFLYYAKIIEKITRIIKIYSI